MSSGAATPIRTRSPRIDTTVIRMSSAITIDSPTRRVRTNMMSPPIFWLVRTTFAHGNAVAALVVSHPRHVRAHQQQAATAGPFAVFRLARVRNVRGVESVALVFDCHDQFGGVDPVIDDHALGRVG